MGGSINRDTMSTVRCNSGDKDVEDNYRPLPQWTVSTYRKLFRAAIKLLGLQKFLVFGLQLMVFLLGGARWLVKPG